MTDAADLGARASGPDRVVAAFDFDGTVVPGDSLVPFVWRVAGPRRFLLAAARHGPRAVLATALHLGSRDAAKAAFVRASLASLPADEIVRAGEWFAERLAERVSAVAAERIRWHAFQGHELVLVSASLQVYLAPLGQRLGFDAVLATILEVGADGRLTGSLAGANVRGPEKLHRLRSWLGPDPCELWAYGDGHGDRELLAAADHGYRVRRGRFPAVGG